MDVEELRRRVPTEGTFEGLLGTVYDSYEVDEIGGHLTVLENMLNPSGDTPLGVYATVAEGAASVGAAMRVWDDGMIAVGLSNDTSVTRQVSAGRIDFRARCLDHGADLAIWSIDFRDPAERVVALSTVRVAIRPRRAPPPRP